MEGVLSKNGLCLEAVMYGGGFVRGFFCPRGFCPEGVLSTHHLPYRVESLGGNLVKSC